MSATEQLKLVKALIPIEVLCGQIRKEALKEVTSDLQNGLLQSLDVLRDLAGMIKPPSPEAPP
jgi:hypothetical protein